MDNCTILFEDKEALTGDCDPSLYETPKTEPGFDRQWISCFYPDQNYEEHGTVIYCFHPNQGEGNTVEPGGKETPQPTELPQAGGGFTLLILLPLITTLIVARRDYAKDRNNS